ncbi:MAG: hypothetical protein V4507_09260 [Verrucomicrobiota bacterium]
MNTIYNLLKKDHGHLKWLLLLWCVLLTPACLIEFSSSDVEQGLYQIQFVTPFIQTAFMALIISLLVLEEPLVGSRGYWLTRPILRKTLLISKISMIVFYFIILPVIVEVILFKYKGASSEDLIDATLELFIKQSWCALGITALATLTSRFKSFVMLFAGYEFASYAIFIIIPRSPLYSKTMWLEAEYLQRCHHFLSMFLIILFGSFVIYRQYRYQKTKSNWIILGVTWLITILLPFTWNKEFLKEPSHIPFISPQEQAVELHFLNLPKFTQIGEGSDNGKVYKTVSSIIDKTQQDKSSIWISKNAQASILEEGKNIHSDVTKNINPFINPLDQKNIFEILYPKSKLLDFNGDLHREYYKRISILRFSEEEYPLIKRKKHLQYLGVFDFTQYFIKEVGRTLISNENTIQSDANIDTILSYNLVEGGYRIKIESQRTQLAFSPHPEKNSLELPGIDVLYALYNPKTEEILAGNISISSSSQDHDKILKKYSFTLSCTVNPQTQPQVANSLDEEWLKNAFLVHCRLTPTAKTTASLTYDDFSISPYP